MRNRKEMESETSDDRKSPDPNQENEKHDDIYLFGWRFRRAVFVTHLNILMYSTCFWIQTGTLPVLTVVLFPEISCLLCTPDMHNYLDWLE